MKNKNKKTGNNMFIFLLLFIIIAFCFLFVYFRTQQTIRFEMIQGPITNPLMGWVPWATIEESEQPFTLVYADLTWRELEPQEGRFDFESFETRNQFERWRAEGKKVVFRFVLDRPDSEEHLDIPDWLYDKIAGDGDFYNHDYGKGFSPNYANQVLIAYHQKAINALGKRYANDNFIAYIELGSIGHWGEWHVKSDSGIRPLPNAEIRDQYVNHYIEAFPNTYLLLRRPFSIASKMNIGFYNDMTADYQSTMYWLDWIQNGGTYDQTGEIDALSSLPNQWQIAPIGGEQTSSLSDEEIYGSSLTQTLDLLRLSHTTFIGPNGPYDFEEKGELQDGIDQVLSSIGYRLFIHKVQMPKIVYFGDEVTIKLIFNNGGVAPLYYNWPVYLYLFDDQDNLINIFPIEMDICSILPERSYKVVFHLPINTLQNGQYKIAIAIHDPATNTPAVQFAMKNSRGDLIQILGSFEIDSLIKH